MIDLESAYKDASREIESGYGYEHSSLTNDDVVELVGLLRKAEKDAARYRWLRDIGRHECGTYDFFDGSSHKVDSSIDEAMRESEA